MTALKLVLSKGREWMLKRDWIEYWKNEGNVIELSVCWTKEDN